MLQDDRPMWFRSRWLGAASCPGAVPWRVFPWKSVRPVLALIVATLVFTGACTSVRTWRPGIGADAGADVAGAGGASASGPGGHGSSGNGGNAGAAGAGVGGLTCEEGMHPCAGACVRNDDPHTCGRACTACPAPVGGSATCNGTMCGGGCSNGETLCLGMCMAAVSACSGTCAAGTHACGNLCLGNDDVTSCGSSCAPCPVPWGAVQATCAGGTCGFVCGSGFHACGDACRPDDDPAACGGSCTKCPTTASGGAACVVGQCTTTCTSGLHPCGDRCVSDADPMTCGQACTACPVPTGGSATCSATGQCRGMCPSNQKLCSGACVATSAACTAQCPTGTHDCGGVCADNRALTSCGSSCSSCSVPTGATAASCNGTSCDFTCGTGYHRCGSTCARDDDAASCGTSCQSCPADPHGKAACSQGTCTVVCETGYHLCGTTCVSNSAPATCGQVGQVSCSACQAPTGGTVTCDGLNCIPACPNGQKVCNGACVANTAACNGACPVGGTHNCSGTCRSDSDVASCGTRCTPCPSPAGHGQPACAAGGSCTIMCDSQYRQCPGTNVCVSSSSTTACCADADCKSGPTGTVGVCSANTCSYTCASGYKSCGSSCVSSTTCCSPCANGFACKAGSCPSSCTGSADCTANHFCVNGACIGKITQISSNESATCTLHDDGVVRCWGANGTGQLGSPDVGPRPAVVPLPRPAAQIAPGRWGWCAVLNDGAFWCWGLTDRMNVSPPGPFMGLTSGVARASGNTQGGCVVTTSGTVKCWGENNLGQLGIGSVDSSATPIEYPLMNVSGPTAVASVIHSGLQTCTLNNAGSSVWCWGDNVVGECGVGMEIPGAFTVTPNPVTSPTVLPPFPATVKQLAAGYFATYALLGGAMDGVLLGWGRADSDGRGPTNNAIDITPGRVTNTTFKAICDTNMECAVTTAGAVLCWGSNLDGELGIPPHNMVESTPRQIPGISGATKVACGWGFRCAVLNGDLGAVCWGKNELGTLGNGMTSATPSLTPVTVAW